MKKKDAKSSSLWSLGRYLGLLLIVLLVTTTAAVAQEGPREDLTPAPQPDRRAYPPAPEREPVIVEQEIQADGAVRTVMELPIDKDAYIASERPQENFGDGDLFLGYNLTGEDNFGAERILIYSDVLRYIPAGAQINEAQLKLRLIFSSPDDDDPMPTVLRRLASPWEEMAVTWNSEPSWTPIDDVTYVGSSNDPGWYQWDVTDLVAAWMDETVPNNGVEIIGDEAEQQRERVFYSREQTTTSFPRLVVDYTESTDSEPPVVSVEALPEYSGRTFTVSWSGEDVGTAGIDYYDVQYRVDEGEWQDWLTEVEDTSEQFANGENGRFYEFRARGVDRVGNVEPFGGPEAATTVDNKAPVTTVDPLPTLINAGSFGVSWTGDDNGGSGIKYYDIQYCYNGGNWILWQQQTVATSFTFINAQDGVYEFEARAVDNLDNREGFANQAEATIVVDAEAPFVTPQVWLPFITRQP